MTDSIEVECIVTKCPQIVITPPAPFTDFIDGYNLTHLQSGFYLLGPFPSLESAQEGADKLASFFSIADWDEMGKISRSWQRSRVKQLFGWLHFDEQKWMRQHGAKL